MMLTEHRRCFNEIIEYCNKLAYNGLLEPKKGRAKNNLFIPMQFINTSGDSKTIGSSRSNEEEAGQIVQWMLTNQERIIRHYQQIENSESVKDRRVVRQIRLADIVGIITPFTGQKGILQTALRKAGLDINGLTIGTVHALQGAERSVILFSSTYGANDVDKSYFYDMGVNMLNVAVSRAKEAFVLFGSQSNFERKANSPSMILYKHIQQVNRQSN